MENTGHEDALAAIINRILQGKDLTPHLSRGIKNGIEIAKSGKKRLGRRKDLDLMLNDWGVHHLHLSTAVEADGFVARTKPVLFAVFHHDDAYLLDLVAHGRGHPTAWTQRHILEIMAQEWPEAQLLLELKAVLATTRPDLSEADHDKLRKAGLSTSITIDGKAYLPRLGITTAGTPTAAALIADRILRHAVAMENELRSGSGPIWATLLRARILPPDSERLRFVFLPQGYGLYDELSKVIIKIA